MAQMDLETRRRRLKFRAWHRGIQEADLILGGFVDDLSESLSAEDCQYLESLFEEQDQDILAWASGARILPEHLSHPLFDKLRARVQGSTKS